MKKTKKTIMLKHIPNFVKLEAFPPWATFGVDELWEAECGDFSLYAFHLRGQGERGWCSTVHHNYHYFTGANFVGSRSNAQRRCQELLEDELAEVVEAV